MDINTVVALIELIKTKRTNMEQQLTFLVRGIALKMLPFIFFTLKTMSLCAPSNGTKIAYCFQRLIRIV